MQRSRGLGTVAPLLGVIFGLGGMVLASPQSPMLQAAPASQSEAPTANQALAEFFTANGESLAGPCVDATSPGDIGKVCYRLVDEQEGVQAYLAGRTFSEFDRWLFVAHGAGGWSVVAQAPLDANGSTAAVPWPSSAATAAGG